MGNDNETEINPKKQKKQENQKKQIFYYLKYLIMSDYEFVRPIFVTDKNGDVWKKIGDGYIHRMYGLFWDGDPNDTPDNLKKRIAYENAKRATKHNKYNWGYI